MIGKTRTSDTNLTGQMCLCTQHPAFLSKNQLAKDDPDSVVRVVIQACVQSEHCTTIWTGPPADQGVSLL